ncbi:hypothetical protein IOD14_43025 [Streptomyces sp. A2-16]|uniref:hypothetical protein n=1 Tax=Streptomyces sp. A2-16 TaxID=2781734 RepID=UPI001BB0808C|nr:hypothetical protein [Streptomyces sp. A2-16]QUC62986.1 hypothetical protein IOD14_43025 [Streptomyces sp. A2-16]
MADIFGVIASIGVVASLLVSAWQTRELTRQTAINNGIAGATARYNGLERLHYVESFIAAEPELHGYFYGGLELPAEGNERWRVLNLLRMLADTVDYGLMVNDLNPEIRSSDGWQDYALLLRASSPAFVYVVNEHPNWWAALSGHWAANPIAGD